VGCRFGVVYVNRVSVAGIVPAAPVIGGDSSASSRAPGAVGGAWGSAAATPLTATPSTLAGATVTDGSFERGLVADVCVVVFVVDTRECSPGPFSTDHISWRFAWA
jgi:hypothetical protein